MRKRAHDERVKDVVEEIKKIKPMITSEDRKAFMEKYDVSESGLSVLLSGVRKSLSKNLQVLEFFKERIRITNKKIESVIKN
ncbi:MAG: hypothetical protein BGO53_08835 [Sphingobacteriales bacterium 39-19]|nr:hypothetical protein [Sphingobacteriales bacterium]OJW09919.1 MAG: hypothetical protein BGO53_08835 [Sphingobacteriales bacterium 39-19]